MLQRLAAFLRCWFRQGFRNSVRLQFGKHDRTTLEPRGLKSPFTLRTNTADVGVFRQVFVDREYDHPMLAGIHPKQIIDAGAHIGSVSILFAARFPDARIIAIEPDAKNFELLKLNTKGYENIIPINAALWCEDTQVGLSNPEGTSWAFRVDEGSETGSVKAVTLSTLLNEFGIRKIDILKMDVEGAEESLREYRE